jgi:hypothetical protein
MPERYGPEYDEVYRPNMTPDERARHAIATMQAFGWHIQHHGHIPDDGWPVDIIANAIKDAVIEATNR